MGIKGMMLFVAIILIGLFALTLTLNEVRKGITGYTTGDKYLEDAEMSGCVLTGNWDAENSDFKMTICPEETPIMKAVGIGVSKDSQSSGRAYCCKADNFEVYDCQEEEEWEIKGKDFQITTCSEERPIMRGVGIKVDTGNQAGGKAYCCKGRNFQQYSCALEGYWKERSKDNKLTFCSDDRFIMKGVGFSIQGENQDGGKAYCCKGRVEVIEGEKKVEIIEEADKEKTATESEEKEGFGKILAKLFCRIIYLKNEVKYKNCWM